MRNVRRRGIQPTAAVAYSYALDYVFDWRYGTETHDVVRTSELEAELENRGHAVSYQPSKARPFLKLLGALGLPEECTFVDVGSGKGKILLLAALRFRRVVGLEFSAKLCAQARRNIDVFRRSHPHLAPIELVEGDATQCVLSGDENVFFLYNPFDGLVLAQFLQLLGRSLRERPRKIWLIYSVPIHAEVVLASGLFAEHRRLSIGGHDAYVYSTPARVEKLTTTA
jgi:SAM-dependent methyltransferase